MTSKVFVWLLLSLLLIGTCYTQVVRAVAGNGGFSGQAATLRYSFFRGMCQDKGRQLIYLNDANSWVYEINAVTGESKLFAGNGMQGSSSTEVVATAGQIGQVCYGCHVDEPANVVYIADTNNNVVRMVNRTSGLMKIVAGTGVSGSSGDNGPATSARLNFPIGVSSDAAYIYIGDYANNKIRRVEKTTGIISTFAGDGGLNTAVVDNVLANMTNLNPQKFFVANGTLYIADTLQCRIRAINMTTGIIRTVVGTGTCTNTGDGGDALLATTNRPVSVHVDENTLYLMTDATIRRVNLATGIISAFAGVGSTGFSGDGGPAIDAQLNFPEDVTSTSTDVFIADRSNTKIRKVNKQTGIISTFGGFVLLNGFYGNNVPALESNMNFPAGVDVDALDRNVLYISDNFNHRVRMVNLTTGIISTFAGNGNTSPVSNNVIATTSAVSNPRNTANDANFIYIGGFDSRLRAVNRTSNIITIIAGNGIDQNLGDGGLAVNARINAVYSLLRAGTTLYIGHIGYIRSINLVNGIISTFAGTGVSGFSGDNGPATNAQIGTVYSMTYDSLRDTLIFADSVRHRVRAINRATGTITTIAGNGVNTYSGDNGAATSASVGTPQGVAYDAARDLLHIADRTAKRIRTINRATGIITTTLGTGIAGALARVNALTPLQSNVENLSTLSLDGDNLYFGDERGAVFVYERCLAGTYTEATTYKCAACPFGSFSAANGSATCTACQSTLSTLAVGASSNTSCVPCIAGTYAATVNGFAACVACPRGSYSNAVGATSNATCQLCPVGTASNTLGAHNASFCIQCAQGFYQATPGATTCTPCNPGQFATAVGATSSAVCQSCATGTFSLGGVSSCTQCSTGTYAASTGSSSCTLCNAGTASNVLGATSAATCQTCGVGSVAPSGSSVCTACGAGTSANQGGSQCVSCAPGTFAATVGSVCQSCPAGSYSSTPGATSCLQCYSGSYSTQVGATSIAACQECPMGTYSNAVGASSLASCQACPKGTYSTFTGAKTISTCISCVAGTFSTQDGATSSAACQNCAAGTFSNPGANACSSCAAGSFSGVGAPSCSLCAAGSFNNQPMSASCSACNAGSFSATNSTSCLPCSIGFYAPSAGTAQCLQCLPGYISNTAGSTACSACTAGAYAPTFGTSTCIPCQAGSFSNAAAATQCAQCSPGFFSNQASATSCTGCAAGTFASASGSTTCSPCPTGFTSTANAAFCTPVAPTPVASTPAPVPPKASPKNSTKITVSMASNISWSCFVALVLISLAMVLA